MLHVPDQTWFGWLIVLISMRTQMPFIATRRPCSVVHNHLSFLFVNFSLALYPPAAPCRPAAATAVATEAVDGTGLPTHPKFSPISPGGPFCETSCKNYQISGFARWSGKIQIRPLSVVAAAVATVAAAVNVERAATGTDANFKQSEGLLFAFVYKPMAP